jgi:hypothetical protein
MEIVIIKDNNGTPIPDPESITIGNELKFVNMAPYIVAITIVEKNFFANSNSSANFSIPAFGPGEEAPAFIIKKLPAQISKKHTTYIIKGHNGQKTDGEPTILVDVPNP